MVSLGARVRGLVSGGARVCRVVGRRAGPRGLAGLLGMLMVTGCGHSPPTPASTSGAPSAAPDESATPSGASPSSPALAAIGLADPHAGTAAGAHLGRAAAVPAASIAALPQPVGRGALPRGTRSPVVFHGPRSRHQIALTFDSNMTDAMLRRLAAGRVGSYANVAVIDELQRSRTPATFFLAGKWVQAYPGLTRRIAADPRFELASHSWAHLGFRAGCYDLGTLPRAEMAADVERSFEVLSRFTAHPSRYFRFPGGCYDDAALAAIAATGCTVVEYDDVSGDAFGSSTPAIVSRTVRQARPGSIVVLHITEANARHTADALPAIIRALHRRGLQPVTLGELLK